MTTRQATLQTARPAGRGGPPIDGTISSRRAAENQSLYRSTNERLKALNEFFVEMLAIPGEWICECADIECVSRISVSVQEYESARSNPRMFIVCPGHIYPHIEVVVAANERFALVEKIGEAGEAAELLAALD